ncbi:MAG: S8 family serine peptidase, partial [bacterium]|nr:S8 family serine peptidase [bacterium]
LICVLAIMPLAANGQNKETKKKTISNVDQLPRHTYKIPGTVSQLVTNEKTFEDFAAKVRKDIETDLNTYDIQDKTTLRDFYGTILAHDALNGKDEAVLKGIERLRKLVDKPGAKLMAGVMQKAMIQAGKEVKDHAGDAFKKAFARNLAASIGKLPWKTIQEDVIAAKNQQEIYSKNLLLGIVRSQLEPAVKKAGYVSSDMARQLVGLRYMLQKVIPLKKQLLAVYTDLIAANRIVKADIWEKRSVDLTGAKNLTPVVVSVWDTGVDTGVFPKHLFTNPNEKIDGKDNDGNGFVDDVHGIAYTFAADKTTELLYKIKGDKGTFSKKVELIKGFLDQQAAIDSPEASAVKKKLSAMKPGEVVPFLEDLMHMILYMHGTHVGGIVVDGNPYARILTARQSFEYRAVPLPMTVEWARKIGKMYKETVGYLKANGVRAVNMSWSQSLKEVEGTLASNGIGKDAAERGKMAREMFDIMKKDFYDAVKNAPGILFVTSAGNEDNDPRFQDYIPGALGLPNIMVVGAVDRAGDETTFTSFGAGVDVYANGYNVESFLPGGDVMPASGTSMSSPQVVNLAAKLLALNPKLKTLDVKKLIIKGAEKSKDGRILLINPKHSVKLLKKK